MGFLTVLLMILKIIGIVLASLIGLILLLICMILFVPIRYKGKASYIDTAKVHIKASYLLHILTAKYTLNGKDSELIVRVLGCRLGKGKKKKSQKSPSTHDKKVEAYRQENKSTKPELKLEQKLEQKQQTCNSTFEAAKKPEKPEKIKKAEKPKKNKKSIFKNLNDKYNSFKEKWNTFKDKRDSIFAEINDEGNRDAVMCTLKAIGKLLKHVLPRRHRINIVFGTGDPASTGQLLGGMYGAAALVGVNIVVTPDFENKVFECNGVFKGRIRVISLVIIALKLYRNKNFRQLLKKITDR